MKNKLKFARIRVTNVTINDVYKFTLVKEGVPHAMNAISLTAPALFCKYNKTTQDDLQYIAEQIYCEVLEQ